MAQHVFTGSGVAATTPTAVGQHYIDTTTKVSYISVGTSSSADWETSDATDAANAVQTNLTTHVSDLANPHAVTKAQVGLTNVPNVDATDRANHTGTQSLSTLSQSGSTLGQVPEWNGGAWIPATPTGGGSAILGSTNRLIWKNDTGTAESNESYTINTFNGLDTNNTIEQNNISGHKGIFSKSLVVNALQDSPDDGATLDNYFIEIDTDQSGFQIGTNYTGAVVAHNTNIKHVGVSNSGGIVLYQNNFELGNGTDPIDVNGFAYAHGFGTVNSGVTLTGGAQGYGFQPRVFTGAILQQYSQAFYDSASFEVPVPGYNSFNSSPSLFSIKNNSGFQGFSCNPTVGAFEGNSGFTGFGLFANLGTFDTGNFVGMQIQPTIAGVLYSDGLVVDMSNVTVLPGGRKNAATFRGDVQITGALDFGGVLTIGALNAYIEEPLVDGGGQAASIHSIISNVSAPDNSTIANIDVLGTNTACLMNIGDDCVLTSAFLGISALGLPAVLNMGSNSTIDRISGATFALSMAGTGTGSSVNELSLCRALCLPDGVTTVNRLYGYKMDLPFGDPGTQSWGAYIDPVIPNYFAGSVKIGVAGGDLPTTGYSLDVMGPSRIETSYGEIMRATSLGISFFGSTAVAKQSSSGPQTAGAVYTSTEQTMIQEMYNALRSYGLLT